MRYWADGALALGVVQAGVGLTLFGAEIALLGHAGLLNRSCLFVSTLLMLGALQVAHPSRAQAQLLLARVKTALLANRRAAAMLLTR